MTRRPLDPRKVNVLFDANAFDRGADDGAEVDRRQSDRTLYASASTPSHRTSGDVEGLNMTDEPDDPVSFEEHRIGGRRTKSWKG
jgi:hypothetical protein